MSCPYFKESCFGICIVPEAIHVPSIDEMERFCFKSWYFTCPNIAFQKGSESRGKSYTANGSHKLSSEQVAGLPLAVGRDRDTGRTHE